MYRPMAIRIYFYIFISFIGGIRADFFKQPCRNPFAAHIRGNTKANYIFRFLRIIKKAIQNGVIAALVISVTPTDYLPVVIC